MQVLSTTINAERIEMVKDLIYLSRPINAREENRPRVQRRIGMANITFFITSSNQIKSYRLHRKTKIRAYNRSTLIRPFLLYASEIWACIDYINPKKALGTFEKITF